MGVSDVELRAQISMLRDGLRAQDQFIAEQNDRLRTLLEHCRREAARKPHDRASAVQAKAYGYVMIELEDILGNSTVVAREVDPRTGLDKP